MTKISRRDAFSGVGAVALGGFLSSLGYAEETAKKDACWEYVPVDPRKAAVGAYEYFADGGCLYATFKGAALAYADAVEAMNPGAAAAARNFPFVACRCGRGGFGRQKELCGAVAGAIMFYSCIFEDYGDVVELSNRLAAYCKTAALPEFVPEKDENPNFHTAVANGLTCREMGGAWMKDASEDDKKVVGERCKRHAASIVGKTVELMNAYVIEKANAKKEDKKA